MTPLFFVFLKNRTFGKGKQDFSFFLGLRFLFFRDLLLLTLLLLLFDG